MDIPRTIVLFTYFVAIGRATLVGAFGIKEPVSALLTKHVSGIARLKEETQTVVGSIDSVPYNNDVFYLRYCVEDKGIDDLKATLAWRQGEGKSICDAAVAALAKATENGKWNNDPVRNAAPNANKINQYITPSTTLTTTSSQGDLVYCIRAGLIDDKALMASLGSVEELVDFFLYCKEVNALVANDRSLDQDRLVSVITVNDLNGLKLIGGDATFRQALSAASKKSNTLYPALAGPTLLLNLPMLLSALVKLFTPLFPPEVNARLKFERGPLKDVTELLDISHGGKDRESFLKDLDALCY
ncbi:CRAL/TRIO domain containing protein [Nitzschia inconspicua]|uniref:CRAL/TRIO domain containing protein n=1 Tax=Nitzschia inconspicua TaxID=303405 RepID=A0A9K3LAU1_9STRA|nr:CRAL/TRIO domain containing protein [Nitzschia inconspicua]